MCGSRGHTLREGLGNTQYKGNRLPMEQLAAVTYVVRGHMPLMAVPDMRTPTAGGESYCEDGSWVSAGWYSQSYEACTYEHAGQGRGAPGWTAGHAGYEDAQGPAENEGRRPRRRGGRRRREMANQGSSTPTSGTSAPAMVGLQAARSQPDVAQADSEDIAAVLREVETEEGKAAIMAKLDAPETRQETLAWMADATFALAVSRWDFTTTLSLYSFGVPL